jgi:hypothetical protein
MRYLFIALLLGVTVVHAATFLVAPGESIQSAVNSAQDYDTVLVADGTYEESVVLYGKTLTIASHFLMDSDTSHIGNTVIRPGNPDADTASCLIYGNGEEIDGRVVGLTLADGRGTSALIQPEVRVGGCIHIQSSAVTIENCHILNGRAFVGGGVFVEGTLDIPASASVVLNDVTIANCYAGDSGGGVFVWWATAIVSNCVFESDTCANLYGGLQCQQAHVEVDNSEFRHCYGWVGGMDMLGCTGHVRYSLFEENGARPISVGMCHFLSGASPLEFSGNILRNGSTEHIAASFTGDPPPNVTGNVFENNISTYLSATVLVGWIGGGDFAYNIVRNNINDYGGAVQAFQHTDARIHHNLIENNRTLLDNFGSAFICVTGCNPTLDSNLFVGNEGFSAGWGFFEETHLLDMRNNWWGHETGPYNPTLNPFGQGDTVLSDSILFIPWLIEAPDTTRPSDTADPNRPLVPGTWRIMNLYPNPFNSEFRIILAGFASNDFKLALYDILGREAAIIHKGSLTGGQLTFHAPPELASGVYFICAADRNQMDTRKVVFLK